MGECQSACCEPDGGLRVQNNLEMKNSQLSNPISPYPLILTLIVNKSVTKEPHHRDELGFNKITFDNNATYTGELKDGMIRHGFGK